MWMDLLTSMQGESPAAQGDDMTAVQERMQTLLVGAARQASLQPTGPHGSFMRYVGRWGGGGGVHPGSRGMGGSRPVHIM